MSFGCVIVYLPLVDDERVDAMMGAADIRDGMKESRLTVYRLKMREVLLFDIDGVGPHVADSVHQQGAEGVFGQRVADLKPESSIGTTETIDEQGVVTIGTARPNPQCIRVQRVGGAVWFQHTIVAEHRVLYWAVNIGTRNDK